MENNTPTEADQTSINQPGSGEQQESAFGTNLADVFAGLDTDLDNELKDKVPATNDAAAQEADRLKKEEASKEKPKATETDPDKDKSDKDKVDPDPEKDKDKPKDPEPDEDHEVLEAEAPGGAHASVETKVNWKKLQDVAKSAKAQAATLRQEAETYKKELDTIKASGGAIPEELNNELTYLRQRIAELDISSSPDFQKKYDSQLSTIEEGIYKEFEVMEATGLPAAKDIVAKLKEAIKESGGVTNYNWNNLLDLCEQHKLINGIQRRKIEGKVANAESIAEQRESEVKKAGETSLQARERTQAERKKLVTDLDSHIKEFTAKNEWTKPPVDPGEKATPEQKAEYEAEKKFYTEGSQKFMKLVNSVLRSNGIVGGDGKAMPTPKEAIEAIFDSVRAQRLDKVLVKKDGEIKDLNTKIEELETELGKFRKAGNTTQKKSAPSSGASTKVEKPAPKSAREAMDSFDSDLDNFVKENQS